MNSFKQQKIFINTLKTVLGLKESCLIRLKIFILFLIFGVGLNFVFAQPSEINSIEDLDAIRNGLAGSYILMTNLDFNNPDSYDDPTSSIAYTTGDGWEPIGTFTGNFEDNGYKIINLCIDRDAT